MFLIEYRAMGGHSHWAGIKHKKALLDAKRGKAWTKIIREITIAAKLGGGDLAGNPRLRKAVDDARNANMPQDNIKRAIQRGTGQIPGAAYEELTYEGYAPAGVALLIDVTTDNRNRTLNEIKTVFTKNGGSLGAEGCVAWMFKTKGLIRVPVQGSPDADTLLGHVLDLGAEDLNTESDEHLVTTAPEDLEKVAEGLKALKIPVAAADVSRVPQSQVPVPPDQASHVLKLIEALEELDDVKSVSANFDIPEEVLTKFAV